MGDEAALYNQINLVTSAVAVEIQLAQSFFHGTNPAFGLGGFCM